MNALVTGSAGFIGFHLIENLIDKGYNVLGIDNFSDYYDILIKKERNSLLIKKSNLLFRT